MKRLPKKAWVLGAGVIAALALAATASATTTFDPSGSLTESNSSGKYGFVGKGDVQTPWGWNNQALQNNAGSVKFSYESIKDDAYAVTCEWDTGNRQIVHHIQTTHKELTDSVAYDVKKADRTNPQGSVTGFKLTGTLNEVTTSTGSVPQVGDTCPGNSGMGLVTDVQADAANSSSSSTLYASSDASSPIGPKGPTAIWVNGVSVL